MDPSHARKYSKAEIELAASRLLMKQYPRGITLPVEIDLIAERHERVDGIVTVELLEDKFKVAAILTCKPRGRFDISVDQDTFDYHGARASFSIAHELGHIVLHSEVCDSCVSIDDSITLMKRINKAYGFIERDANYFAGAILIPQRTLAEDTAVVYEALVKDIGYDARIVPYRVCSTLATRYGVSFQPMEIRLSEMNLQKKIISALRLNSPYLDL